ncbi:hypothetical protein L914_11310 [Phytophthora nicotianae]|uniref:Uncharacterized protein n=3 Tax=Phytophthora nicotianae TaxID=4792 RepID=V9EVC3_PHYNI|nr:hypothetical protein F443_11773 [Phytophthora nicotianae P1569]ETL36676.1 hypothetical protein L916_11383 [Phytophthora nicotianae]ETM43150.1 hypothetical protein L914_11310 [Phytophthora nicotianae]ETO71873.1 hypothetical protein F444_11858 [Phytophthora nicotianae P1976]
MLPGLTDRWGATLQVLLPSKSESASASARRNALQELKEVDAVRISASGKGSKTRYTVEVFMVPSTSCSGISTASTEPAVRIEREQSDFKDVADELHKIVSSAHSGKRCELCSAILNWFVLGENPDAVMLMFVSNERIARKLTKFLQDLLTPIIKYASDDIQGGCSGQTLIPLAVHKFLFNPPATCASFRRFINSI